MRLFLLVALLGGVLCAVIYWGLQRSLFQLHSNAMKIKVSGTAAESGRIRVWLRRIPVSSATIYAFRIGPNGEPIEIASADVYGRGEGSSASEKIMLTFRLYSNAGFEQLTEGENLELKVRAGDGDGYVPAELDIVDVP